MSSKLDDILNFTDNNLGEVTEAKRGIKDLMLEIIGEDEDVGSYHMTSFGEKRNEVIQKLRKEVEEL